MNETNVRAVFSIICVLAMFAVAGGGIVEILRRKQGESLLRTGQFRLRMFSVFVWLILLGSLAYAVSFLWPHDERSVQQFLAVISGVFSLLIIALLLLAYDLWQVGRQRRASHQSFERQLEQLAREEARKVKPLEEAPSHSQKDDS